MVSAPTTSKATLLRGDCRAELGKVATESVDLVVTSPPYADQRATTYGGVKPDDYVEWFLPIAEELRRVLKPNGTFILNIKEPAVNGEQHTYVLELILEMRKQGWLWTEEFVWHKKNCYPGKWPNRFRDAWERLLQFNKQRQFKMNQEAVMVPVGDWYDNRMHNLSETDYIRDESKVGSGFGKKVANWLGRDMVYPTNVLHRATECGNRNHSAVFPYWLPEWFIDLFTDPGDTVLDPFIGSGTTAFVALDKGRNVIGIELSESYYENLRRRLKIGEEADSMQKVSDEQITEYVAANIGGFHERRLERLNELKLNDLLSRKNPYLFKSKNMVEVPDLVGGMLDAHLSSQEEEMFGVFLEGLAIFIAGKAVEGWKSSALGIDLEFFKEDVRYIVSVKSGPNWGNSSQVARMKQNFLEATRILRQNNPTLNVIAINGCCYGRTDAKPGKKGYFKFCGQDFWELISNDRELYTRIIEPLGQTAKRHGSHFDFLEKRGLALNRLIRDFMNGFCDSEGAINWEKLVAFTSASTPLTERPISKREVNALRAVPNVCDTMRNWGMADLAARIEYLTSDQAGDDKTESPDLESLRGFLMIRSAVESEGDISLSFTEEGLLCANWQFPDQRSLEAKFLDIDRVTLTATDANGQTVKIRNSQTAVRRDTALKKLIESGLITRFAAD